MKTSNSYQKFERVGGIIFFIIIKFKLTFIIKILGFKPLFFIAQMIALTVKITHPYSSKEIKSRMKKALNAEDKKIKVLYKNYLNNLFFHVLFTIKIPYIETEQLYNYFSKESMDHISNFFKKINRNKPLIISSTHTYQFILIALLSKIFFENNIKVLATFALSEPKTFKKYVQKLKTSLHYNFHNSVNVLDSNYKKKYFNYLNESNYTIMFGDIRFKTKQNDIKFKLNNLALYSNNGLERLIKHQSDSKIIFIYIYKFNSKFEIKFQEINDTQHYYTELSKTILKHPSDWLLWFHTPLF